MTDQINNTQVDIFTVPNGVYSPAAARGLHRRATYQILGEKITVKRNYIIGGSTYKVNSIFDLAAKKTAADGVQHLIDADLARSENIQLTFPESIGIVAVAEDAPLHTQSA